MSCDGIHKDAALQAAFKLVVLGNDCADITITKKGWGCRAGCVTTRKIQCLPNGDCAAPRAMVASIDLSPHSATKISDATYAQDPCQHLAQHAAYADAVGAATCKTAGLQPTYELRSLNAAKAALSVDCGCTARAQHSCSPLQAQIWLLVRTGTIQKDWVDLLQYSIRCALHI